MERVLEPEVMDIWEEAVEYDAMDFTQVNTAFTESAIALAPPFGNILDAGTGTARIPILFCQHSPQYQIIGIDLAKSMLEIGKRNIEKAGLAKQIVLELSDAKHLPYHDGFFDMVISNSLIHHLHDPLPFFQEIKRVLKPNGAIFIRDLIRPANEEIMNTLVEKICVEYNERQTKLVRDSLYAALTVEEIKQLIETANLENVKVYQSSDYHWTADRPKI